MKVHNALVIHDRALWTKGNLDALVPFVGFHRLGKGADGELCRQAKALTHLLIELLLQLKLRGAALRIRMLGNPRTGRVKGVHRIQQRRVLLRCWEQFHLQCRFRSEE